SKTTPEVALLDCHEGRLGVHRTEYFAESAGLRWGLLGQCPIGTSRSVIGFISLTPRALQHQSLRQHTHKLEMRRQVLLGSVDFQGGAGRNYLLVDPPAAVKNYREAIMTPSILKWRFILRINREGRLKCIDCLL